MYKDIKGIFEATWGHVDEQCQHDIEQILHEGFPSKFMKYYSRENKIAMLRQWNGPTVKKNRENRLITMNKEGSNCDLDSGSSIFCLCFALAGHVSHTMNMKKPDAIRLCLNASNKYHPEYWAFMME